MISFSIDKSHVCFIIFPVVLASWVAMHITKTLPLKLTVSFILAVLAFSAIAPFFSAKPTLHATDQLGLVVTGETVVMFQVICDLAQIQLFTTTIATKEIPIHILVQ